MTLLTPGAAESVTSSRGGGRWWLAPPLVLALLGGWLVARRYGFWYDELYTAEVAPLPLGRLLDALITGEGTIPYLRDAPPSYNAPYYVVAHGWLAVTGLSPDETGLRLLSLVSAIAAVAVFTRAVGRLADPRVGVGAGLVLAANPFVVRYSAEARGYALVLLCTALAVLGLARWLDGSPHGVMLFGVAAAGAGLAHWFALLVPLALAVAAVVLRRRDAVPVVAAAGVATLPALGLVGVAVANGVGGSGAEWIANAGLAVPWLTLRVWADGNSALLATTVAMVVVAVAAGRARSHRAPLVVAGLWVALPVVAVTAAEAVRPVFVARYRLPAAAGVAVLVALGVTGLPRRASMAALVAVMAASTWSTVAAVRAGPLEDGRGAVAAVAARHRPGEPVVAAARWDALSLDHYARRDHPDLLPDVVLPDAPVPPARRVWVVRRARPGVKGDPDKLAALDAELAGRGLRVAEERRLRGRTADVVVQRWE